MAGKFVWGSVAAVGVLLYRRIRSRSVNKTVLKANFGEKIISPDDTGAVVATMPNDSDIELYIRCWGVDRISRPRGVVMLVHGGMWHSKYFEPLAKELVNNGFVVYSYDLQSHGLSGSARGVRGDVNSFDELVSDTQGVLDFACSNHSAPVFLYGESMGALIVLLWELTKPSGKKVDGLICVGSVVQLKKEMMPPGWAMPLLGLLARLCPQLRVPNKEFVATFDEAFGDPAVPAAARKDPLVVFEAPTLHYMFKGLAKIKKLANELSSIKSPLLILHGLADIRVDWENSQKLNDEALSEDKTLKLYEGMKHQLLQELPENKRVVFDDILEWLKARTTKPQKARKSRSGGKEFDLPDIPFPSGYQEAGPSGDQGDNILDQLTRNGF